MKLCMVMMVIYQVCLDEGNKMKIYTLWVLILLFSFSYVHCGFEQIDALSFDIQVAKRIQCEIDLLIKDKRKTDLDFSNIGAPSQIGKLLAIIYFTLYPQVHEGDGPMVAQEYLGVRIEKINLSGNSLKIVPAGICMFRDLKTVDLTENPIALWCKVNIARNIKTCQISFIL